MASPNINEVKIFNYECEKCGKEWIMTLSGQDSRRLEDSGYFCTYCGTKHTPEYPREELPRFATDEEAGFPESWKEEITIKNTPSVVQKGEKTAVQLNREDRLSYLRCKDGGWWNPITEKCQGEGIGNNHLDNDSDS